MGLALSLLGLLVVGVVIGFGVYWLFTNITIKGNKDE